MRKATALVSRRLLRDKLPGGRAAFGKQNLATVSQELTVEFDAGFNDTRLTRTARFAGWMPAAIEHLQGCWVAYGKQILVTVSRALTADCGHGREVGLAEGQA